MQTRFLQKIAPFGLIFSCTLLFAKKIQLHIDEIPYPADFEKYADVKGFLLVDESATQPFNTRFLMIWFSL